MCLKCCDIITLGNNNTCDWPCNKVILQYPFWDHHNYSEISCKHFLKYITWSKKCLLIHIVKVYQERNRNTCHNTLNPYSFLSYLLIELPVSYRILSLIDDLRSKNWLWKQDWGIIWRKHQDIPRQFHFTIPYRLQPLYPTLPTQT